MSDREISRLVTGKATKYLRASTALLLLALTLVATFLAVTENQRQQAKQDFTTNKNVHVIEVSAGVEAGAVNTLHFADRARIKSAAKKTAAGGFSLTSRYELGFGMPDAGGTDRFITGLDGDGARLLGLPKLRDRTAYAVNGGTDKIVLEVPVVDVHKDGMSTGSSVQRTLDAGSDVSLRSPFALLAHVNEQSLFVSGSTFRDLVATSFKTDWATFQREYDATNPYGVKVIRGVYVYVDDLNDVRATADAMEKRGYSTSYTLKAFNDLAGSLDRSAALGLLAVLAVLVVCLVLIFLSLNSYMNLAHRDMGILKHFGFSGEAVRRIFSIRVARVCALVAAVVTAFSVGLNAILVHDRFLMFSALNIAVVLVLLAFVYVVTTRWMFGRHTSRGVLELLKLDREFE